MPNGDEIVVRGRPLEPDFGRFTTRRVADAPVIPEGVNVEPVIGPAVTGDPLQTRGPAVVVPVITEIIATGKKPPARPPVGVAGRLPKVTPATLFAVVGGLLLGKTLEEVSQQRLESEFAELMAKDRSKPDTPLRLIPTMPMTEIIVTARRFDPVALLRRIPQPPPLITPDFDPSILVPFLPRVAPIPGAVPQVEIPTPTAPETRPAPAKVPARFPSRIPLPLPATVPFAVPRVEPTTRPATSPQIRPGVLPFVSPSTSPFVAPARRTATRADTSPLTRLQSDVATSLRRRTDLKQQTQAQAARGTCPPCPKCKKEEEQEKPRSECWKKLVKEALLPSMDTEHQWVEIDCLTGKEI